MRFSSDRCGLTENAFIASTHIAWVHKEYLRRTITILPILWKCYIYIVSAGAGLSEQALFCKYFTLRSKNRQEMTHVSEWGCDLLQHIIRRQLHQGTPTHNRLLHHDEARRRTAQCQIGSVNSVSHANGMVSVGSHCRRVYPACRIINHVVIASRLCPVSFVAFFADTCQSENDEEARYTTGNLNACIPKKYP